MKRKDILEFSSNLCSKHEGWRNIYFSHKQADFLLFHFMIKENAYILVFNMTQPCDPIVLLWETGSYKPIHSEKPFSIYADTLTIEEVKEMEADPNISRYSNVFFGMR